MVHMLMHSVPTCKLHYIFLKTSILQVMQRHFEADRLKAASLRSLYISTHAFAPLYLLGERILPQKYVLIALGKKMQLLAWTGLDY